MALDTVRIPVRSSPEGDIDRRSEALLGKIAAGSASAREQATFRELAMQRSYLMTRPKPKNLATLTITVKGRR